MLSCNLMGGLGNQLFQTAVTLATAKKYGKKPVFPSNTDQGCSRKISYNESYFHKLEHRKDTNFPLLREVQFNYQPILLNSENNKLFGYYQTEKYFLEYKDYILDTLTLPPHIIQELDKKYEPIINSDMTVSIHIRRGDYMNLQNFHYVIKPDYYERALKYFSEDSYFIIFSDDLEWCKNQDIFKNLKNKIFINDIDYHELYLMSQCKHNIIANSSFSWWGAYMNKNTNKIVIASSKWFGEQGPKQTQDMLPSNWIII